VVVLTVDGEVKPAISTLPADPSISYGPVSNELENTRRIFLFSADRPDLQVTKLTSTNPALIAVTSRPLTPEEAKAANTEKGHQIEVTLKPTSILGAFNEEVLVETDHPQKSELRFKVVGIVTGPITIVPEKVIVRGATTKAGGTALHKILVRGRPSVNFTVEKTPRDLEVTIERMNQSAEAKGSSYKMLIKVRPGAQSGRIVDEIVLKTDDPLASELKIPVDVLVLGS
jgi:hypothetical protein